MLHSHSPHRKMFEIKKLHISKYSYICVTCKFIVRAVSEKTGKIWSCNAEVITDQYKQKLNSHIDYSAHRPIPNNADMCRKMRTFTLPQCVNLQFAQKNGWQPYCVLTNCRNKNWRLRQYVHRALQPTKQMPVAVRYILLFLDFLPKTHTQLLRAANSRSRCDAIWVGVQEWRQTGAADLKQYTRM